MSHASHTFTARSPCEGSSATPLLISAFVTVVVVVVTHTHTLAHTLKWGALYRPYQASWVAAGKKRLCAYLAHLRPLCCCCCYWCYSCPITNRNFSDTYINWPLSVAFPPSSSSSPSCRAASCQAIKRQNTWLTFRRQLFFFFWVVCCCSLSLFVVFWDFFFRFVC